MFNSSKKIIRLTIKENILLIFFLLIYIFISTKLAQFLIHEASLNLKILVQMFSNHISEIIIDIISLPILNSFMFNIKSELITSKNINEGESIYSKILKSQSIKLIIKSSLNFVYSLILFFLIFEYSKKLIIFCSFYVILLYYLQKYIIKKRREAWFSTSNSYKDISKTLNEIELIKQDLLNIEKNSIQQEKEIWIKWGYILNITKLLLISCVCLYIYHDINSTSILFQLWILTTKFLLIYGYIDDFSQAFTNHNQSINKSKYDNQILELKNVKIFNKGPFNLKEENPCIILTADNSTGKTLIAKAIANLINYEGEIISPKTFYISLDSQNIQNMKISKGESILNLINIALKKDYELFIFDEVLDILSNTNKDLVLNKLEEKKLFIITHKILNIKRNQQRYTINDNKLIKI